MASYEEWKSNPPEMLQLVQINGFGGSARKVMNGKPQCIVETKGMDAPVVISGERQPSILF